MPNESLREILAAIRAGDHAAFARLVERYGEALRHVIRQKLHRVVRTRVDSEDVVQEAWRSLWEARGRLEEIDTDEALLKYLQGFVRNRVRRTNRDVRRHQRTPLREQPLEGMHRPPPTGDRRRAARPETTASEYLMAHESLDRLRGSLAPAHWRVVELRLEGHTQSQIAALLEVSERTVRRILKQVAVHLKSADHHMRNGDFQPSAREP